MEPGSQGNLAAVLLGQAALIPLPICCWTQDRTLSMSFLGKLSRGSTGSAYVGTGSLCKCGLFAQQLEVKSSVGHDKYAWVNVPLGEVPRGSPSEEGSFAAIVLSWYCCKHRGVHVFGIRWLPASCSGTCLTCSPWHRGQEEECERRGLFCATCTVRTEKPLGRKEPCGATLEQLLKPSLRVTEAHAAIGLHQLTHKLLCRCCQE